MGAIVSTFYSLGEHTPIKTRTVPCAYDPRSPSVEVMRSPIVVPETPIREGLPPKTTRTKLNELVDPRSPVMEFDRTPILTPIRFSFSELEQALVNEKKSMQISPIVLQHRKTEPQSSCDNSFQKKLVHEMDAESEDGAMKILESKMKAVVVSKPPEGSIGANVGSQRSGQGNIVINKHLIFTAGDTKDLEKELVESLQEPGPVKCSTPIKEVEDKHDTPKNTPVTPLSLRQHHNSPSSGTLSHSQSSKNQMEGVRPSTKGTPVTTGKGLRVVAHHNHRRRKNKIVTSDENTPIPVRL